MSLLELCNGYLPAPYPRGRKVSSWKVQRLVQAMVIGIDAEIVDQIVGIIPPNTPLTLEKAARAVGLSKKSARQLQGEAEFQAACLAAVEALRACQEPANIAVAASIRDDRTSRARDRLNAIEVLRGPKPAAGVTVNVAQNNGQPMIAGYVVNLGMPARDHEKAIEGKIIDASPREGNAGEAAADADAERREAHRFRPR